MTEKIVSALMLAILAATAFAAPPSTQPTARQQAEDGLLDLTPTVDGGQDEVQQPAKLRVKGNAVTAASADDAVNGAIEQVFPKRAIQVAQIRFPGGRGYVGQGRATYRETYPSRNAQLMAQHDGYWRAYVDSKINLEEGLTEQQVTNFISSESGGKSVVMPANTLYKGSRRLSQRTTVEVRKALQRAAIVYAIEDKAVPDVEGLREVTVTVVVTPATLGLVQHSVKAPSVVSTKSLRAGLEFVRRQITAGIAPPAGARIITTPQGMAAFVGFGSMPRLIMDDLDAQELNRDQLRDYAQVMATGSLLSLLRADWITWRAGMKANYLKRFNDLDGEPNESNKTPLLADTDPDSSAMGAVIQRLRKSKTRFYASNAGRKVQEICSQGTLPPLALKPIPKLNENGHRWIAIAVYVPDYARRAQSFNEEMYRGRSSGAGSSVVSNRGRKVLPLPTGRVTSDEELQALHDFAKDHNIPLPGGSDEFQK